MDVRIGCYVVVLDQGRVLLAHWNAYGRSGWTLPGGGMEDHEDTEATAIRECLEETGMHVRLSGLLGVHTRYIPAEDRADPEAGRELRAVRVVHAAEVTGGRLTDEVGGSSDRATWFDLDDLPQDRIDLVDIGLRMLGERTGT